MRMGLIVMLGLLVIGLVVGLQSTYIIREGEQAVVTQFGKPVADVTESGLHFKLPFAQRVNRLEKRLLPWDGDPEQMQTRDKKRIFIDVWARWRIIDPQKFFRSVRTEKGGQKTLDDILDSAVRDVVARNNLIEVVRSSQRKLEYESDELARDAASRMDIAKTGRSEMEKEMVRVASEGLARQDSGIELTELHIKRVNYIESVRRTVYDRMKSERMRIANLYESEAQEEKNRILGRTQKELDQIEGEKNRRASEIRGGADAEVIRIAAEAYSRSPEFYFFLRRLEAYRNALIKGTRLVLSTDNEFLRELLNPSNKISMP